MYIDQYICLTIFIAKRGDQRFSHNYGLVVRIPAFHAGGPGSIPGVGGIILLPCQYL